MEEEAVKMNTKVIQSFEVGHFNYSKHNLSHFLFEKCKFFLFFSTSTILHFLCIEAQNGTKRF